jgi:VWFA-related protein
MRGHGKVGPARKRRTRSGAAWVLCLAGTVSAWTQQATPPATPLVQQPVGGAYTLQVKSQLVVLDVVVTDAKGANVKHLVKNDFNVYEDKTLQTVQSFDENQPDTATVKVSSTAELDKLEPRAPVSILVIDELTTSFEDLAFARYSLEKYLKSQGDTLLQPTMLIAANYNNIAVLRDYTTSRQDILSALEHHVADYGKLLARGQNPGWTGDAVGAAFVSFIGVAEATAGHPGHKNMIWIGRGFPMIDRSKLQSDDQTRLDDQLATCTTVLRDARVTLYTIDPAGLSAAPPTQTEDGFTNDPFAGQFDFESMALATGGRAMHGQNDVNALIDGTIRNGANFYTMAYRPTGSSESSKPFRSIRVLMNDSTLLASTRTGYYATPAAVAAVRNASGKLTDRFVMDLTVAGNSLLVYDAVPLRITRDPTAPNRFVVHLRESDLPIHADAGQENSVTVVLLAETFDAKNKMLNHIQREISLKLPPQAIDAPLRDRTIDLAIRLPTQAPAARLRFVLRDNASGRIGAQNYLLSDDALKGAAGPAKKPEQ